jgi:hypothetical protein
MGIISPQSFFFFPEKQTFVGNEGMKQAGPLAPFPSLKITDKEKFQLQRIHLKTKITAEKGFLVNIKEEKKTSTVSLRSLIPP